MLASLNTDIPTGISIPLLASAADSFESQQFLPLLKRTTITVVAQPPTTLP